jgi:hypothetical protein
MKPNLNFMYVLSKKALSAIESLRPGIVNDLAKALNDCSGNTINRHIRENLENGDLTKYAALEVLQDKTGLDFSVILIKVKDKQLQPQS